jgi:DNA-binding transcriptional MerR regulator
MSMATLLTIGEFSRMTHLSVKALRHYHDVGVLAPAAIDPFTGYRSYDANQVVSAQVIRRLRDLGMSLDSIRTVVGSSDVDTRNREIAAHLERMELQLEQTQAAVAGLRALLAGPAIRPAVEVRAIPAVTALAVRQVVSAADLVEWGSGAFDALSDALSAMGAVATSPFGALFPGDFFEIERSEITVFAPVEPGRPGPPGGDVRLVTIPAVEAAVALHEGAFADIDRTYGALGTVVAERAIGTGGPIREYYLVSSVDTDDEREHRTEVCWPVFLTGVKKAQ